jgi:uncharacterized protein YchJ
MTTKEFWKLYMSKDGCLKHFDAIFDFFSEELPAEFVDGYDVGEVILETRGHNETAKNFDKVLKFTELIQQKHPALYEEFFQYFDDFLIDYHSFQGNRDEAEKAFSNFYENPEHDFDQFLFCFKKLLFYQHFDIIDKTATKSYDIIKNSDQLISGAEYELAILKYYINLEFYYNQINQKSFDKVGFEKSLLPFEFKFQPNAINFITLGLLNPEQSKENIVSKFTQNRDDYILTVESLFLAHMATKKFGFPVSGRIWDKLMEFLEEESNFKRQKPDSFFAINTVNFEKFLSNLAGDFFTNNRSEMIAVLWGSVYVYDFLLSIGLINDETHADFITTSRIFKGKVIANFTSELWNSNFVHYWEKPESVSENEFNEESKIFKKSISIKNQEFKIIKKEIKDELDNIGELSDFILQGAELHNGKDRNIFEKISQSKGIGLFGDDESYFRNTVPIIAEPKIGRNEPCPCGSGKKYKKCCGKDL